MYETLIIFIITFAIVILFSRAGVIVNNRDVASRGNFRWNKYYFLSYLILALFLGTRDGVGRDFYTYKSFFETGRQIFIFGESKELGYIWLTDILHLLNLDYHSFFMVTSFITVLFLFNSFKNVYHLLPIGIFIFFVGGAYVFIINGVRQGIAMMAFYNALKYLSWDGGIKDKLKNCFSFFFYIALGALFHYSILIFIPLYFILHKRFLALFNKWILIIIVSLGFIINSVSYFDFFSKNLIEIFPKYKMYSNLNLNLNEVGHFRLGAFFILFINLLPIMYYDKIKKKYPESRMYFVMFAFGIGLIYAFSQYMLIYRLVLYLSLCSMFVFAYTCRYLKKQQKQNYFNLTLSIFIPIFLIVKFIYELPQFMEIQIIQNNFSLWFISLMK